MRAGYGRDHRDIGERLTWRQIRRYFEIEQRRRRHARADQIEAVALGTHGGKKVASTIRRLRG